MTRVAKGLVNFDPKEAGWDQYSPQVLVPTPKMHPIYIHVFLV